MSRVTLLHFISKYGVQSIENLCQMLQDGKSLQEICDRLSYPGRKLYVSQLSTFISDVLEKRYIVRLEVLEYLEMLSDRDRRSIERAKQGRAAIIRLHTKERREEDTKKAQGKD